MENEGSLLSVETGQSIFWDEGGFIQGGSSLTFFKDGDEMFWPKEVDGESSKLCHLKCTSGDVESSKMESCCMVMVGF